MKKLVNIILFFLAGIALDVGCSFEPIEGQETNYKATVIERVNIYDNVSMDQSVGTLKVQESVVVKRMLTNRLGRSFCWVVGSDLKGWVDCSALDIEH